MSRFGEGVKELYMYILGIVVVGGAILTNIALIKYPIPGTNHDTVLGGVNQLYILAAMVVGYFYGSSKSSADKNAIIAQNSAPALLAETETKEK